MSAIPGSLLAVAANGVTSVAHIEGYALLALASPSRARIGLDQLAIGGTTPPKNFNAMRAVAETTQ